MWIQKHFRRRQALPATPETIKKWVTQLVRSALYLEPEFAAVAANHSGDPDSTWAEVFMRRTDAPGMGSEAAAAVGARSLPGARMAVWRAGPLGRQAARASIVAGGKTPGRVHFVSVQFKQEEGKVLLGIWFSRTDRGAGPPATVRDGDLRWAPTGCPGHSVAAQQCSGGLLDVHEWTFGAPGTPPIQYGCAVEAHFASRKQPVRFELRVGTQRPYDTASTGRTGGTPGRPELLAKV